MDKSFEEALILHCAPTLAGIKPANLFRVDLISERDVESDIENYDRLLDGTGISVKLIKRCQKNGYGLVYTYRRKMIEEIIGKPDIRAFLDQEGYHNSYTIEECLAVLQSKLCLEEEFPHEIGIFLGYPLGDVREFINNEGRGFIYSGIWKAYSDKDKALAYNNLCFRCIDSYMKQYRSGANVLKLAVAV